MREKIAYSAARSFANNGYTGCSITMLCEGAGITRNQLFHYFSNKSEVALFATERMLSSWRTEIAQMAPIYPDPRQRMRYVLDRISEQTAGGNWPCLGYFSTMLAVRESLPDAVRESVDEAISEMHGLFRTAIKELRKENNVQFNSKARAVAAMILSSLLGADSVGGGPGKTTANDVAEALKEMLAGPLGQGS